MKEKSLSYGIDHKIPLEGQKYIFNKFGKYIKSIYMGIPNKELNAFFTSRIYNFINSYDQHYYDTIIDYAKSQGIEINFTLNGSNDNTYDEEYHQDANDLIGISSNTGYFKVYKDPEGIKEKLKAAAEVINNYNPTEVCTIDPYIELLRANCNKNIKFDRSFFEGNPSFKEVQKKLYDVYIVRNSYFYLTNSYSLSTEYRVCINLACTFACQGCRVKSPGYSNSYKAHLARFNKELTGMSEGSFEKYLAYRLWSGLDITILEKLFPQLHLTYKYANRGLGCSLETMEYLLDNYISNKPLNFQSKVILSSASNNYDICDFLDTHKDRKFDYSKFLDYKLEYWDKIKNKEISFIED